MNRIIKFTIEILLSSNISKQRKKNLRNAFQAAGPVTGLRILVVDDVYTTGSTVEAMAECLLENGAKAVFFVTLCTGNI